MLRPFLALALLTSAMPVLAQTAPVPRPVADDPEIDTEAEVEDIVVTGQRERGSVAGDIPPVQQIRPAEIRSYGVGTVNELLTELAPQTRSGRGGRPVVLLDGRRISGFQEIRDLPTEAIARVDILPEEVALKFGFRADQRAVNFVLRRRFRSVTAEVADRIATEGGRNQLEGQLGLLQLQGNGRLNLNLDARRSSALTETERDVVSREGTGDSDPFRTLLPETRTVGVNAVYAREIGRVGATLNGQLQVTDTDALLGREEAADFGLRQQSRDITGRVATTLTGDVGRWRWTFTGAYDRTDAQTFTDVAGADANRAESSLTLGSADLLLSGTAFALPAGDIAATFRVGGSMSDLSSRSFRFGRMIPGDIARDLVSAQGSLDLPIASRSRDVLAWLGQLSVNLNAGVEELSDFGTLTRYGYGANWSPLEGVRLIASVAVDENPPSAQELGNPIITIPRARVFDYSLGETALVTSVAGGNPDLIANKRRATRLGLSLRPWSDRDLTLQADYSRVRTDDPIAGFPAATAAIADAFEERFTRGIDGRLTQVDARPINFPEQDRSEIRYGINFSKPIKSRVQRQLEAFRAGTGPNPFAGLRRPGGRDGSFGEGRGGERRGGEGRERSGSEGGGARSTGDAVGAAPGQGGAGGGGGRGGFGRGGRGGQGGGRLQFAFYHTINLASTVLVAENAPRLDLLRGDAIGNNGGQSRHELEGQAGYSNDGLGARLSVNYRSGTEVTGGTAGAPERLEFGALTTVNLRLFADLGQRLEWVRRNPWMRGVRVGVGVENLFNHRQRVRDAAGAVPLTFQPDLIDPLGRSVRLSIRKLFF